MNAVAKSSSAWSLSEQVVSDFIRQGSHLFDAVVDPAAAAELLA